MIRRILAVSLTAGLVTAAGVAGAADLPKQVSWTAYGTTSSGYANGIAIGNVLKKNYGTEVRLVPGKNDVSP